MKKIDLFGNCDNCREEEFYHDADEAETCPICGSYDDRCCGCSIDDQLDALREEQYEEIDKAESWLEKNG